MLTLSWPGGHKCPLFPGVFRFSVITGPSTFLWASHLWVGRRQKPIFGCDDRNWFLRRYHTQYNDIGTVLFKVFTLVVYNAQQWPWSPVFSVSLGRASRPFPYWNLTDTSHFSQTICPVSSSDHRRPSWFEAAEGSSDRDGLDQGHWLCTMDKPSLAYNLLVVQPFLTHGSVTHTVALSLDVKQGSPALYALPRLYVSYGGSLAANAWRITKPCSVYNMATSNNWALSWFFTTFCSIDAPGDVRAGCDVVHSDSKKLVNSSSGSS